jgi:hypothetical protein
VWKFLVNFCNSFRAAGSPLSQLLGIGGRLKLGCIHGRFVAIGEGMGVEQCKGGRGGGLGTVGLS